MAPPPSSPSPPATMHAAWRSISGSSGPAKPRLSPFRCRNGVPEIGESAILMGHDETLRHRPVAVAQAAKLVTLGEMTTGMAHELSQP